jgi:hypothetical protein
MHTNEHAPPISYSLNLLDVSLRHPVITIGIHEQEMNRLPAIDYRGLPAKAKTFLGEQKPGQNKLWIDFAPEEYHDKKLEVKLESHKALARIYLQNALINYLKAKNHIRLVNFTKNPVVFLKDHKTDDYVVFNKFELKFEYKSGDSCPRLRISFTGQSYIMLKTIEQIQQAHPTAMSQLKQVVYNRRIYPYHHLDDETKQQMTTCYPLLNQGLAAEIKVAWPFELIRDKHQRHINQVEKARSVLFPNGTEVAGLHISQQWAAATPGRPLTGSDYRFGKQGTGQDVMKGLLKNGPFRSLSTKTLMCFFIYRKQDHLTKEKLSQLFFPEENDKGLIAYAKGGVYYKQQLDIVLAPEMDITQQVEQAMQYASISADSHYLAFYLSPYDRYDSNSRRHQVHYRIKEVLLQRQVASQTISIDKVNAKGTNIQYWLPNIAMAAVAKLGGIPWVLNKSAEKSLVVGFGIYQPKKYHLRYVGSSFCFGQDGTFEEFDYFDEQMVSGIAAKLEQALKRYQMLYGNPKQMVIHYHKRISNKEFEPILKKIHAFDVGIPVFVVKVNSTRTVEYFVRDLLDSAKLPKDGSVFRLKKNDYLMYINTYKGIGKPAAQPMPVRCYLTASDNNLLNDEEQVQGLLQQLYDFSHLHWRSLRQPSIPVTVMYPTLLASHIPWFAGAGMTDAANKRIWFL